MIHSVLDPKWQEKSFLIVTFIFFFFLLLIGVFIGQLSAIRSTEKRIAESCDKQGTFIADGWKFSCSPIAAREGGEK